MDVNNNNNNTSSSSLILPTKPFHKIGNRRFICNLSLSYMSNLIGLPITITIFLYNFIQTLYLLIQSYNNINNSNSNSSLSFPYTTLLILHCILFTITFFQLIYVSLSNSGYLVPFTTDISNDMRLNALLVTIRNQDYFLKYCITCHIVRDLRVFHCSKCNLCILRHDHHCPWLSNCIGYNNHKKFLCLIAFTFVYGVNALIMLIMIMAYDDIRQALTWLMIMLIIVDGGITCVIVLFVMRLIVHQLYMISTNQTTSEYLRRNKDQLNPYTLDTCKENWMEFWKGMLDYRRRITYNDNAKYFIEKNYLMETYFNNKTNSGNDNSNNKVMDGLLMNNDESGVKKESMNTYELSVQSTL